MKRCSVCDQLTDFNHDFCNNHMQDEIERQQATIGQVTKERNEARQFIVSEYRKFRSYHPYAHTLRSKYPWLEEAAAAAKEKP